MAHKNPLLDHKNVFASHEYYIREIQHMQCDKEGDSTCTDKLLPKQSLTSQQVKWCPGCGSTTSISVLKVVCQCATILFYAVLCLLNLSIDTQYI